MEHAYLTIAQCSPSRISILTGKYPHATGAEDLHMPLPAGERMVPSYLREAGYFTGHMQKTHYGPNGEAQFEWYSPDLSSAFPGFLDSAQGRPFFLWVGVFAVVMPAQFWAFANDVYDDFAGAIKQREDAKETLETTLIGITSAELIEADLRQKTAFVTVKFISEQVNVTRDTEGRIVDGDPNHVAKVTDIWTFARNTRSRDPNWALVATRSPN